MYQGTSLLNTSAIHNTDDFNTPSFHNSREPRRPLAPSSSAPHWMPAPAPRGPPVPSISNAARRTPAPSSSRCSKPRQLHTSLGHLQARLAPRQLFTCRYQGRRPARSTPDSDHIQALARHLSGFSSSAPSPRLPRKLIGNP
jgi:hypothetical protein